MSTISASTTTTTAYKVTADTTGTLVLQTGATPTTAVTIGTSGGITWLPQNGGAFAAGEWSRNASWGTYYKAPASGTTADIALVSANGTVGWKVSNDGAGYTSNIGSGGTVTQATSKSTSVTLNKPTGQITMNNAALAAGAYVEFALTNSFVTAQDLVIVNAVSFASYRVEVRNVGAGGVAFRVTNITGGSLSEAIPLNFAVIKGATS